MKKLLLVALMVSGTALWAAEDALQAEIEALNDSALKVATCFADSGSYTEADKFVSKLISDAIEVKRAELRSMF